MISISLGISTLQNRMDKLKIFFKNSHEILKEIDEIIIVVQGVNSKGTESLTIHDIIASAQIEKKMKIVKDQNKGLNSSRNLLFEHTTSDYLWIMDDDTILDQEGFKKIKDKLFLGEADIYCGRTKIIGKDRLFKSYPAPGELNKLQLLKLISIELIVSMSFIKREGVKYNENVGYGTKYTSCGETLFLLEAYESGATVRHFDIVIVSHPFEADLPEKWNNSGSLYSKGVVARRIGIILGLALILRWGLRANSLNGNFFFAITNLFRGYLKNKFD